LDMSERDALERIRAELKQKIDIMDDNAIDQIESRMKSGYIMCRGFAAREYCGEN